MVWPDSKLAICRRLQAETAPSTQLEELRLDGVKPGHLYEAMDWLLERQEQNAALPGRRAPQWSTPTALPRDECFAHGAGFGVGAIRV